MNGTRRFKNAERSAGRIRRAPVMDFTKAFAIRRGFLLNPEYWFKFLTTLEMDGAGTEEERKRAQNWATDSFGANWWTKARQLGIPLAEETIADRLFDKITFAIDFVGKDVLYDFLHTMWPDVFTICPPTTPIPMSARMSWGQCFQFLNSTKAPAKDFDVFFTEGVLKYVSMSRSCNDGARPTKQTMATHIKNLFFNTHKKYNIYCLKAIIELLDPRCIEKLLYSMVVPDDSDVY